MLTLGSLFDGIGGWLLAAERAGIEPESLPGILRRARMRNIKQEE